MKLALYKGRGNLGNALIRWWTKSPYSHCELVIGEIWYSSSVRDGGVRAKRLEPNPAHWDYIELPWADAEQVQWYFRSTQGEPYGWLDLIKRQVFNRPGNDFGAFCSEWCAEALGLPTPQQYSPGTLGEYCEGRTVA
ncbi:hypothetical protein [Thauera sp.]|uniref:hypothetical protein n=1 Tax=Thauera sp. TaxID=1905334 RepID=UPI0039E71F08